ncbi:MAG: hypothetical protein ACNI3H_15135 [Halarcobacter ebronensis]|uniref:hypothetical protein n=1 Tax=Halarcobacter ebronensis TaxID=1462615 RepID=UPI003C7587EA
MIVGKNLFIISIVLLLVFLSLIALQFNNVLVGFGGDRLFSQYDSQNFYEYSKVTFNELFSLYNFIAYKAYPAYLISIDNFYSIFFNNVTYQMLILSNYFLYLIIILIYYKFYFKSYNVPNYIFFLMILEPSLIAFLLTLEREIIISIFLGLFFLSILYISNKFLKSLLLLFLLFVIANIRIEISLIILFSSLLYFVYHFYKKSKKYTKLLLIVMLFCLSLFFFFKISSILEIYLRHLGSLETNGGFGSLISSLSAVPRIILYSLFYFVMPIPIFAEKNYLYQYFLIFSGFSYSLFWIFILLNYKKLEGKLLYLLFLLLLLHIGLGGTLFNIRHRVDIVIPLIIMVLTLSKIIINNRGYDYLKKQFRQSFKIAFIVIIGLNLIYYIAKGII